MVVPGHEAAGVDRVVERHHRCLIVDVCEQQR
jgi:hypothetical protein